MSIDKLRGFAICTSPRTGSNYLCQLISSAGTLGNPLEYFNWRGRRVFDHPDYPEDIQGQVRAILSTGSTSNGVYAFKIFAHQHDWISHEINWTTDLPNLSFVYLTRRDLLAQAISWSIALQTGRFRASQDAVAEPVYDGSLIEQQLRQITLENARWQFFFARTGVQPLCLVYEELIAEPTTTLNLLQTFMNVDVPKPPKEGGVRVSIQRNDLNSAWAAQFRKDFGDPNVLHSF